ncbi:hypothetical protein LINPERPRIM_LOCUS27453 [Linum perenne]
MPEINSSLRISDSLILQLQNSVSFGPTLYSRAGRPISWAEKRRV